MRPSLSFLNARIAEGLKPRFPFPFTVKPTFLAGDLAALDRAGQAATERGNGQ